MSRGRALSNQNGSSGVACGLRIVTTSWDDGDPSDLRLAELLRSRRLCGTFYVPICGYLGGETLMKADLQALSAEGFEIGAHSVSHTSLVGLRSGELGREVGRCKQQLEQTLGQAVSMFCYPEGHYNGAVLQGVVDAGYLGARTARMLSVKMDFVPFEMPTSLQAFPHGVGRYIRNLLRRGNLVGLAEYAVQLSQSTTWVELGKRLFDEVWRHGGVWHLYGHSWEIDALRIWPALCEMLDYVSGRDGVMYVTNRELVQLLRDADGHKATGDG